MALKKSKGKVYASNVKKSLAIMGKKTIATAMPSLTETVVSTKEVFNDIRQFSVRERSKMTVAKNQQRRTLLRPINEIIMNAKEDLKSGKWYNEERIYESEMSDMDSFIDDMSGESSDQETGNSTSMAQFNKFISSTSASSKSSARAIADTQIKTAEYLGELSSHQHMQTLVMSRKNHLEHMNKLDNLEKIGMSLAEFNIKTMTQHIQKTETFYDSMLRETSSIRASVERLAKSIDDRYKGDKKANKMKKNPLADIFGGGAFDMTGYKNLVKENLSNQLPISKDMMDMIFKNFKNSPVSSIMMLLGSSMLPGGMKGGAKKLDTAAQGLFRSYIEEMNRWRSGNTRAKKGSTMDSLMQFIGQIAGIDPAKMGVNAKPDLSIYKNQAITLEMENKKAKAIIEVIPSYLSEMLKIMSKGKTDKYFDYDSGKFADRKKTKKEHDEAIERKLAGTMSETYGYMDKKIYSASRKYAKDEVSQKTIEADFKTFMAWLSTTNFDYDPAKMPNNPEKYYALCKKSGLKLRGGAQSYSFIHAAMVTMSKTQYEGMKNERMSSKGLAQDISNRNSIDVHSSGKSALYNGLSKTGGGIKEGEIALVGNPADMKKFMSESILSASELKDYKKRRAAEEGKEYSDATENLKGKGTDVADKIFKKLGIGGLVDAVRKTVSTVTDKLADGMDAVSERLMEYEDRISGVEVDNSVGYGNWGGRSKKSVTVKKVSSSSPQSKAKITAKKYKSAKKSHTKYTSTSPRMSSPVADAAISGAYDYRPYFDTIDSHLRNIATILAQNKTFEVRTSSDGSAIGVMGGGGIDFGGIYSSAKEKTSTAITSIKKTFSGIKSSITKYAEDHDVKGKASSLGGKAKDLAIKGASSGLDFIGKIANGVKSAGGNIAEYLKSDDFKSILSGMKEKASAGVTKIKEFSGTLFEKMSSGGIGNMLKKAGTIGIGAFLSNKLGLGPVPGALIGALFSRNKKNKKSESEEDKEVKEMTETMEEAESASSSKKKGLGKLKAGGNLAKGAFASSILGLGPIPGLLVAKMYNKHKDKKLKEQQDADIKEGEEIAENVEETEKTKKKGLSKFKKGKNMFIGAYVSSMLGLGPIPGLLAAKMWNKHKDKKAQEKETDETMENVDKSEKKAKGLGAGKKLKNLAIGTILGTITGNPFLGIAGALAYNRMKDKKLKKKNSAKTKTEETSSESAEVNASMSPDSEEGKEKTTSELKPAEDNPKAEGKASSIATGAAGLAVGGARAVGKLAKSAFGGLKKMFSKKKKSSKETTVKDDTAEKTPKVKDSKDTISEAKESAKDKLAEKRAKADKKRTMVDVERARDLEAKGDHKGADTYEKKAIARAKSTGDIDTVEKAQSIVANTRIPDGTKGAKEKPKNPKVEGLLSKMGGIGGILGGIWKILSGAGGFLLKLAGGLVSSLIDGVSSLISGLFGLGRRSRLGTGGGGSFLGGALKLAGGIYLGKKLFDGVEWLKNNGWAQGHRTTNEQGDANFADYSDKALAAGSAYILRKPMQQGLTSMMTSKAGTTITTKVSQKMAENAASKAASRSLTPSLANKMANSGKILPKAFTPEMAQAYGKNFSSQAMSAVSAFQSAKYDENQAQAYEDRGATTLAEDARSDALRAKAVGVSRVYKGLVGQRTFGNVKVGQSYFDAAKNGMTNIKNKAVDYATDIKTVRDGGMVYKTGSGAKYDVLSDGTVKTRKGGTVVDNGIERINKLENSGQVKQTKTSKVSNMVKGKGDDAIKSVTGATDDIAKKVSKEAAGEAAEKAAKKVGKEVVEEGAEKLGKSASKKASKFAKSFKKGLNNLWKKLKPIFKKDKKACDKAKKLLVNNADDIAKKVVKKAPKLIGKILGKLGQICSWILAIIPLASALVAAWKGWNNADADLKIDSSFGGMWKLKLLNALLYALDDVLCGVLDMVGLRQWLLELLTPVFLSKKEEEKLAKEQEKQQKEYDKFLQENDLSSEALTFDMYNKMDNGSKKQKKQLEEYKKGGKKNNEAREKYGGYTGQQAYSDMNAGQQVVQNVGNKITGGNYTSNAPSTDIRAQVADLMSNPEVKKALESANYVSLNYFNNTDNSSNSNIIANNVSGGSGGRGGSSKSNTQILKEVERIIHNSRYGNSKSVRKVTSEDMDNYQASEFYKEDEKNEKAKNEADKKKSSADKKTTLQKVGDIIKKAGNWVVGKAKKFWGWLTGSGGRGEHFEMFNSPDDIMARGFIPYLTGSGSSNGRGETVNGYTYYNQKDSRWGNQTFGKYFGKRDTVRAGGCGPTVAAMALENITGSKVSPSTMAKVAMMTGDKVDDGGTSPSFFNKVGSAYGVNFKQTSGISESAVESLKMGRPVPMLGKNGPYGNGSHYLLATNMDNSGRVSVLDPQNRNNNKKYSLRQLASTTQSSIVARGRVIPVNKGPVPFGRSGLDGRIPRSKKYSKYITEFKNKWGRGTEIKFGNAVLDNTTYIDHPNKWVRSKPMDGPKHIIIHYTCGSKSNTSDQNALSAANWFVSGENWGADHTYRTGAHYCLGSTKCYQVFRDTESCCHAGSNHNDTGIGIEVGEEYNGNTPFYPAETEANLVALVNYLMSQYNIPVENVLRHYDCSGKSCPAHWAGENNAGWLSFKSKLNGSSNITGNGRTDWVAIVKQVKSQFGSLGVGYSQSKSTNITINGVTKSMRQDCSGFVGVCLKFYGAISDSEYVDTSSMLQSNSFMDSSGFVKKDFTSWDNLIEGDILLKSGHTEIFAYNSGNSHYVYNVGSDDSANNPGTTGAAYSTYTYVYSPPAITPTGSVIKSFSGGGPSNKSSEGLTKLQALAQSVVRDDSKFAVLTSGLSDIYQTVGGNKSTSSGGITQTTGGDGSLVFTSNEKTNCKKIYDQLKANGFSHNGAVAICANIKGESSFNPDCHGDSGTSYGLCQWHNDRKTSMLNYNSGHPTNSIEHQVAYLTQDMKNYGLYDKFSKNDESIENLVSSMVYDFEKPEDKAGAVTTRNKYIDDVLDAVGTGSGGRGASILPYSVKSKIASMSPTIPKRMRSNGRGPQLTAKSALKMSRGILSVRGESFSDMQSNSRGSSYIYGRGDGDASIDSPYNISLNGLNVRRSPSSSIPKVSSSGSISDDKLILVLESIVSLLTDIKDSNQEISEKNFSPVVAVQGGGSSTGMALGGISSKQSLIDSIVSGI